MATENLQVQYSAASDFNSEAWEVIPVWPGRPMLNGSMQVIWNGLDVLNATIEIELSLLLRLAFCAAICFGG